MLWQILFLSGVIMVFAVLRQEVSGTTNQFWDTVNSRFFVDKSLFIEHFLKGPNHIGILAPRYFGKTTNLNMLRSYFEVEVDKDGKQVERNSSQNYRAFAASNLKIFENTEFFKDHFGKYPVIHLNFGTINATAHQLFHDSFHRLVRGAFDEFAYLGQSKMLTRHERKEFNGVHGTGLPLDIQHLVDCGQLLANLLFKHHQERCILLIDNYDIPLKHVMMSKSVTDEEMINILECLSQFVLKLIESDDRMFKSLFTGCLTVGKLYTLKSNRTKTVSIFRDKRLHDYYGLMEADVEVLAAKVGKGEAEVDELRTWYGGYYVEGTHKLLYNPKSIVRHLSSRNDTLVGYWDLSKEFRVLEPYFDFEKFGEMGEGTVGEDTLMIPHDMDSPARLLYLKNIFCKDEWSVLYIHRMLQFFLELGYYSASDRFPNEIVGDAVNCGFPNEETRADFRKLVFTPIFYKTKFRVSDDCIAGLADSIEKLSPERDTFVNLAVAVEKMFRTLKPRDVAELIAVLRALAGTSQKLPHVRMEGLSLFVKRYDGVGVVLNAAFVKSSAKMALTRLVENRVYEKLKKEANKVIVIGLYMDSLGQCDVVYLYDKPSLADRESAMSPRTTLPPTTTTKRTVKKFGENAEKVFWRRPARKKPQQ